MTQNLQFVLKECITKDNDIYKQQRNSKKEAVSAVNMKVCCKLSEK